MNDLSVPLARLCVERRKPLCLRIFPQAQRQLTFAVLLPTTPQPTPLLPPALARYYDGRAVSSSARVAAPIRTEREMTRQLIRARQTQRRRALTHAFRVAVTGHQHLGDDQTAAFVHSHFGLLLARLRDAHPEGLIGLSGLAAGADTLFAEVALRGGLPLEACLAAADIVENFAAGTERERFLTLCAMSRRIHRLPFPTGSNAAYMALGRWLVDSCDLLIAAWNGLPAAAEGGTADVVGYAQSVGRPVIHIHTLLHTVQPL